MAHTFPITVSRSDCDRTAVLEQLERILSSNAFRNSKRASHLLRHIVEQTVNGRAADLKERTLGVEVFGRPVDYDNGADPVVRTAASELRKRIAQYYHEPKEEQEVRIELPAGSYVPEFSGPPPAPALPLPVPAAVAAPVSPPLVRSRLGYLILATALVAVLGAALWRPWTPAGIMERFWRPYLNGDTPVVICLASMLSPARSGETHAGFGLIAWSDSASSTKIACLLRDFRQPLEVRLRDTVTFDDLRSRPAVLIGAFNDDWTLRLTEHLPFEFRRDGNIRRVVDNANPASEKWSVDFTNPASPTRDYAVISRLLTGRSGKPVLTIAGLGAFGTQVAGDFVTDRASLDRITEKAQSGWAERNLQIVLGMEVLDGHAGPAKIEAIHAW